MTLTHTIEVIDPATAESLLALNSKNRRLNSSTVSVYARAMKLKEWNFDGAPIRISKDNVLLDGQHRLHAVIMSGTSQQFSVWRGMESETQHTMDLGRRRSLADALTLAGETNTTVLAATTYLLMKWDSGIRGSSLSAQATPPQIPEALDYIENTPGIREAVANGRKLGQKFPGSPRVWSLAYALFARIDQDDADYFFHRLYTGEELASDSPILLLRNSLDRFKSSITSTVTPAYTLAIIIKAWNLYRKGVTAERLYFSAGGAKAEKFPEPV